MSLVRLSSRPGLQILMGLLPLGWERILEGPLPLAQIVIPLGVLFLD